MVIINMKLQRQMYKVVILFLSVYVVTIKSCINQFEIGLLFLAMSFCMQRIPEITEVICIGNFFKYLLCHIL